MSQYDPDIQESVSTETLDDIREPFMYRVLLHNDDYTTMEFVVEVLMYVFNKTAEAATQKSSVHAGAVGSRFRDGFL